MNTALAYDAWLTHWNPVLLGAFVIGAVLQWLICKRLREGRALLRMHLGLIVFGIGLDVFARSLPALGMAKEAKIVGELALVGWGVLFIRITGIFFFRVFLPSIGRPRPRILEEIVFLGLCLGWGLVRLRLAGLDLTGLLTTSAVVTAILAFSMKETLGNVLGGLALQLDNSLQLGDWVQVEGVRGKVVEVHWRHTAVLTNEGELVVLPNSLLMAGKVVVFSSISHPASRRTVQFATDNSAQPQKVCSAVQTAIRAALIEHVALDPPPQCLVLDYRDGQIIFGVRYWLLQPQYDVNTDSVIRKHIYTALKRANLKLARPVLDAKMSSWTDARNVAKREAEVQHRMHMLSGVKLFAGFHSDELRQLAQALHVTPFTKNDVITRQGAVANWLYLLVHGEADVWDESNGARKHITTLGVGEVIGELGMLTGDPCNATVTARSNLECYSMDQQTFVTILQERPALANELAAIISARSSWSSMAGGAVDVAQSAGQQARMLGRIRQFFQLP
ncbi:mechanosensitive ion channel family protein [Massilia sp. W12]|uniref:mechanosensitive ion channel family protein n=1 Tax=Massilia sp. W12 TaxID=3126507 RepID=UPI0030D557EB